MTDDFIEIELNGELLQEIVVSGDKIRLTEIVESVPESNLLRHVMHLDDEERDQLISMLTPIQAAELIDDAPDNLAASLLDGLESKVAAKIMEELQSDMQADIVHKLDSDDAEAILSEMEEEDAEGVRKLVQYEHDTAGGLMEWEIFSFQTTETVGKLLRRLASGDDDFERYRGQHPYIFDETGK
ncbi:MAG: magnesium transporter, partial [Gammaproteobacteria bacterium]